MSSKRNGEIDFLRFLFSIVIVFTHFNNNYHFGFFTNGSIAVEFFFIVSGFLMATHVKRMKNKPATSAEIADATWSFIIRKVSSFFSYYICAIFLSLVIRNILIRHASLFTVAKDLLRSIPTFTLTFMGLNYSNMSLYVGNTWYLSAMIIAMFILYPLLLKSFQFSTKVVFPLLSLFIIGYLYNIYGTITKWDKWVGFCYVGILRAVAEIALGASLYHLSSALNARYSQLNHSAALPVKLLLTAVKFGCYLVFLFHAYGFSIGKNYSIHALLTCSIAIVLSFSNVGYLIPDSALTRYLGKISLPIFIFHGFIRWTCKDITGDAIITLYPAMALIVLCILVCIALMHITDYVTAQFKRLLWKTR